MTIQRQYRRFVNKNRYTIINYYFAIQFLIIVSIGLWIGGGNG